MSAPLLLKSSLRAVGSSGSSASSAASPSPSPTLPSGGASLDADDPAFFRRRPRFPPPPPRLDATSADAAGSEPTVDDTSPSFTMLPVDFRVKEKRPLSAPSRCSAFFFRFRFGRGTTASPPPSLPAIASVEGAPIHQNLAEGPQIYFFQHPPGKGFVVIGGR